MKKIIYQIEVFSKQNENIFSLFFFIVSLFLWYFFPVLSIVPIIVLSFSGIFNIKTFVKILLLLLISSSLGLISFTTKSTGLLPVDMFRYQLIFDFYSNAPLGSVLLSQGNWFFDFITWTLAHLITANAQIVGLFWTTFIYFFLFLAVKNFALFHFREKHLSFFLLFCLLITSFVTTTELLKTCISFSVFIYALSLKYTHRRFSGFFLVLAVMLHLSCLFLIPIWFYSNNWVKKNIFTILIITTIIGLFNVMEIFSFLFSNVPIIGEKASRYEQLDDFTKQPFFIMHYGFYIIQVALLYYFTKNKNDDRLTLSLLSLSIILLNFGNDPNFIRFILTYYVFYITIFIFIQSNIRLTSNKLFISLLYFVYFFIFYVRYLDISLNMKTYSRSYMNNDLVALLFSNIPDFLQFKI